MAYNYYFNIVVSHGCIFNLLLNDIDYFDTIRKN